MSFVVDASIVACWALDDEDDETAEIALDMLRHDVAHVPAIWWFEIRNILVVNERRQRITASEIDAFLHRLNRLRITIDRAPDESQLLNLSRDFRLTVYDARPISN